LVKTNKGVKLLKETGHFKKLITSLRSSKSTVLEKRVALWAVGNIGRTKKGISLLKEENIIKDLLHIAENSDYLSLRGTCYYILNFLCSTSDGRKVLQSLN